MPKENNFKINIDIAEEFSKKNYDKIIDYINKMDEYLAEMQQSGNTKELKHTILVFTNIFNFWIDSIKENKLWSSLIRCGILVGKIEKIKELIYEHDMNLWLKKRLPDNVTSIKYFNEMIQLLKVRNIMSFEEIIEKLQSDDETVIDETLKRIYDLQLVYITQMGKNKLYSLTDAGVRYAKYSKAFF